MVDPQFKSPTCDATHTIISWKVWVDSSSPNGVSYTGINFSISDSNGSNKITMPTSEPSSSFTALPKIWWQATSSFSFKALADPKKITFYLRTQGYYKSG